LAQEAEGMRLPDDYTSSCSIIRGIAFMVYRRKSKTSIAGRLICDLGGLPFFDDLPEVRCQFTIVIGKHLIKGPLGPVRRLPNPLFALGGFGLVLLHFGLKISQHGTTPRNMHTTFDSTLACAEKMATLGIFCSVETNDLCL
jgi:hypothetical protein